MVGIDHTVVVKAVSDGGRRDELLKVGHGRTSNFLPNVIVDEETEICCCDCPDFLDNRGAEINIPTAVNLINILSHAKDVKIVILFSFDTVMADCSRGVSDLLTICTKIFGSLDKLQQNLGSLLIGCFLFNANFTSDQLKSHLTYQTSPIMADLVERLFLIDVLSSSSREEWIEQIRSTPAMVFSADIFQTMLLPSDEKKLFAIGRDLSKKVEESLLNADFLHCHDYLRTLQLLTVLKHFHGHFFYGSRTFIHMYFIRECAAMKEYCHLAEFSEAARVLHRLQAAAVVFQGKEWCDVLPFDQLIMFYSRAKFNHVELLKLDQALQLQREHINCLTALLAETRQGADRKEKELLERLEMLSNELTQKKEQAVVKELKEEEPIKEELR